MNKAILIGNLTRDPEMRTTPSGVSCCTFTLAINRQFVNKQTGQREADFINVVAWRGQADFVARYFTKGRKMAVVGSIQTRSYDAQDGSKRYVTEVVAEEVEFVGSPGSGSGRQDDVPPPSEPYGGNYGSGSSSMSAGASSGGYSAPQKATGFDSMDDDELPF